MSSQSKKSWKKIFNLRPDGPSSAGTESSHSEGTALEKDETGDCDKASLALTRPPSYRSQILDGELCGKEEISKVQIYCTACRIQHPLSSFHDINVQHNDERYRCTGSERVLYLCAHAFMTWDQFRREIVDIFPYNKECPTVPAFLTITYARDAGLPIREAVMRHSHGTHCQAWEGEWYGTTRPVPSGMVSFQMREENEILWYQNWHVAVQEIWCRKEENVIRGTGPALENSYVTAMPKSKIQKSKAQSSKGKTSHLISKTPATTEQKVLLLAERLTSFEIYLCPHVNFFSPILEPILISLLTTKFKVLIQAQNIPCCPECGATFHIYIQGSNSVCDVDQVLIIVARVIGTGASAMEQKWLNSSEIRVK